MYAARSTFGFLNHCLLLLLAIYEADRLIQDVFASILQLLTTTIQPTRDLSLRSEPSLRTLPLPSSRRTLQGFSRQGPARNGLDTIGEASRAEGFTHNRIHQS